MKRHNSRLTLSQSVFARRRVAKPPCGPGTCPLAQSRCRCCSVRGRRRGPEQTALQQGRRHEPTDHDDVISASPLQWQWLRQFLHLQTALGGQAQHLPRRLWRLTHRCRKFNRRRGRPHRPPSISTRQLLAPPSAAAMRGPLALGLYV